MLSDQERLVLKDIENKLGAEDPELAERLATASSSGVRAWRYWVAGGILGFFLLISLGAQVPILTLLLAIGVCGVVTAGYLRTRAPGRKWRPEK